MDRGAGLQTFAPSPPPVNRKREWSWRSPVNKAKRQALAVSSSSLSCARPTDSLQQAEPIEELHTEAAIVAIESETASVPAEAESESPMVPSELAGPVPLQPEPAVPDLEPPAEVAAAAAGVDLVVPKAKVS